MNMLTAKEYLHTYLPGRIPLEQPVFNLPPSTYDKIERFGSLTLGDKNHVSIFNAIKKLAKMFPEVKQGLNYSSTAIGKIIDDYIIDHPHDEWFDNVLLYRPDMLVSKTGEVYTNELEIVVGGICTISLLQNYVYGEYTLLISLLAHMKIYQERVGIEGRIAFLADKHGAEMLEGFKWIPDIFGKDIIIATTDQVHFKNDGVYFKGDKIAIAHIYIKAHKLREEVITQDIMLLNHWFKKNIALTSPPSLIIDNKLIMYFLQHPKYKAVLQDILSKERYFEIQTYLPKTYIHHNASDTELNDIIRAPWNYGRYIVKYPTLWGSKKMIASPINEKGYDKWHKQFSAMLKDSELYGYLIIQEMIEVQQITFLSNEIEINGNTKFTPFFTHEIFSKNTRLQAMAVNVTPGEFKVHIDEQSRFSLVERGVIH